MKKGLTMVELVASMAVVLVLLSVVILNVNPNQNQSNARDVKRINDLAMLDRAINEYRIDNQNWPGQSNTLRSSTLLPAGHTQLESASSGWIDDDLSKYLSRTPTDPTNDSTFHYSYIQNGSGYELNARLESMTSKMEDDGGNDSTMFEAGNILTLISP